MNSDLKSGKMIAELNATIQRLTRENGELRRRLDEQIGKNMKG